MFVFLAEILRSLFIFKVFWLYLISIPWNSPIQHIEIPTVITFKIYLKYLNIQYSFISLHFPHTIIVHILLSYLDYGNSLQTGLPTFTIAPVMFYSQPRASLVVELVKNLPAMRETWVCPLGWEDPLEKGKAIYSSMLAWRIPWAVQSMESQRVRHE